MTARATETRTRGHELGLRIAAGDVSVLELLSDTATAADLRCRVAHLRLERLLRYVPGLGPATIRSTCSRAQVDTSTRIGDLDRRPDSRRRLTDQLSRWDLASYAGTGTLRRLDTR